MYAAKSPNALLSQPSEEWKNFYASNFDEVPVLIGTPQHMRNVMADLKSRAAKKVIIGTDTIEVKDVEIQTRDGTAIKCRIYTPIAPKAAHPGLLYIHGGGWTLGDLDGEDTTCRIICQDAQVVVVSVDYRLAPEYPFPYGIHDAYDAFQWMLSNSKSVKIDKDSIIVAGSSAGGNQAAVVVLQAQKDKIPLKGQILRMPVTCHLERYPAELDLHSMEDNKDAPLLCKRSMELFWSYYNPPQKSDWRVSPLLADSFDGLPSAYLQIAGLDPLRDEGLAYAQKLQEAGVTVKVDTYAGVPHVFGYFPQLEASKKCARDLVDAVKWLTTSG